MSYRRSYIIWSCLLVTLLLFCRIMVIVAESDQPVNLLGNACGGCEFNFNLQSQFWQHVQLIMRPTNSVFHVVTEGGKTNAEIIPFNW